MHTTSNKLLGNFHFHSFFTETCYLKATNNWNVKKEKKNSRLLLVLLFWTVSLICSCVLSSEAITMPVSPCPPQHFLYLLSSTMKGFCTIPLLLLTFYFTGGSISILYILIHGTCIIGYTLLYAMLSTTRLFSSLFHCSWGTHCVDLTFLLSPYTSLNIFLLSLYGCSKSGFLIK